MNVSFLSMTSKVSSRGANLAELFCFLGSYGEANSSGIIHCPFGRSFKCNQTGHVGADLAAPAAPAWTGPKAERAEEGKTYTHTCTNVSILQISSHVSLTETCAWRQRCFLQAQGWNLSRPQQQSGAAVAAINASPRKTDTLFMNYIFITHLIVQRVLIIRHFRS